MISEATKVKILDNSGAVEGKCIKVVWPKSGHGRRTAREGDIIVLTITKTTAGSKIKKGDVLRGLVVRTAKEGEGLRAENKKPVTVANPDKFSLVVRGKRGGIKQRFADNSVVLVKMGATTGTGGKIKKRRELSPIGTRARGSIGAKIRLNKNNLKVIAIL